MKTDNDSGALETARKTWEAIGKADPLWGVDTGRAFADLGRVSEFFAQGQKEVEGVLDLIKTFNPELRYRRALDFGCGVGRLTTALAKSFDEVIGVDVSRPMITEAERYRAQLDESDSARIEFLCNLEPDLALFPDQSFDFALSLITLQHLRPPLIRQYVGELCRVIDRPGALVFQLPAERENVASRMGSAIARRLRKKDKMGVARNLPAMEMHGVSQQLVKAIVREFDREVALVVPDERAPSWTSYTYFVT